MYKIIELLYDDHPSRSPERYGSFPGGIDFSRELRIRLQTKPVFYFGLLIKKIHYETLEGDVYQNPIVEELIDYQWDLATKQPTSRDTRIFYYLFDDSVGLEYKTLTKHYRDAIDKQKVVVRRRENVANWLIARAHQLELGEVLESFFYKYQKEYNQYIEYGDPKLIGLIENATINWMDRDTTTSFGTVRESLMTSFTKANTPPEPGEVEAFLRLTNQ